MTYVIWAGFLLLILVIVLLDLDVKMIMSRHHPIPNLVSLAVIAGILGVGGLASLIAASRDAIRHVGSTVPGPPDLSGPAVDAHAGPAENLEGAESATMETGRVSDSGR